MFRKQGGLLIHRAYYDLLKKHGLDRFEALYGFAGGEPFKKNRYRSVDRIYLRDERGGHVFHLKRHHPPLRTRLASLFTGLRIRDAAENEWAKILRLEEVGIPTMTPVAFGAVRKWGLPYRALTLTEHLYGAQKLEDYLPIYFGEGVLGREKILRKRRIIVETGKWARKFHEAGFHHQDFYLGHIFIRPADGDDFSLHLIDLQRVREHRKLGKSMIVKDLAQINFSASQIDCLTRTDRLRFLMAYLGGDRLDSTEKNLAHRIEKKTGRIAIHTRKLLARRVASKPGGRVLQEAGKNKKKKAPL